MFRAQVKHSNEAFLVGDTIPAEELASLSSTTTLPLDWGLWHCCLCHHHLAGVKKLSSGNLVTGFKLDSQAEPDPVCEACKAGKMHADPFPSSLSRASRPSNLSTVMCMVHWRCPLTKGIAIGSHSLMTALTSKQSIWWSTSRRPLLPSSSSKHGLRTSLDRDWAHWEMTRVGNCYKWMLWRALESKGPRGLQRRE